MQQNRALWPNRGLNEYKQNQARVILINLRNEAAPAKSQVYRPVANARLLLPGCLARGDASRLDVQSANPRLQVESTRPPGPRRMPHQPFVRHPDPSQTSAKYPQLLCLRPFPRNALLGRNRGRTLPHSPPAAARQAGQTSASARTCDTRDR